MVGDFGVTVVFTVSMLQTVLGAKTNIQELRLHENKCSELHYRIGEVLGQSVIDLLSHFGLCSLHP